MLVELFVTLFVAGESSTSDTLEMLLILRIASGNLRE